MEKDVRLGIEPTARAEGLSVNVDRESFALSLKTWRLRNNLTQRQVASMWSTSRDTVLKCENGKHVSWATAYKMFARLSEELRKESGKGVGL